MSIYLKYVLNVLSVESIGYAAALKFKVDSRLDFESDVQLL